MRLPRSTPAPAIGPPSTFETLRETTAVVDRPQRFDATARHLIRASHLRCQRGGATRTGAECLDCERIVSIKPSPGRTYVTIRCLWTEADVVSDVMTRAFAAVTVKASEKLGRAELIAAREHVHHLLVVEHDDVVGVICRCDLADPGSRAGLLPLAGFVDRRLWTVPPTTSLATAAEMMEQLEVGILMVTDAGELLGTLTMRDLGVIERGHGL